MSEEESNLPKEESTQLLEVADKEEDTDKEEANQKDSEATLKCDENIADQKKEEVAPSQNSLEKQHSDTLTYSINQFDKNILFIASGALGVSFAFIKDIVPSLSTAVYKSLLFISWYLFALVIFLSLLGHFLSMQAHSWAINNSHLDDDPFNEEVKKKNRPIRILNISMIIANFMGALALIIFIHLNLSTMSKKNSSPKSTGNTSKTGYIGDSKKEIGNIKKGAEVQLRPTTPPKPSDGKGKK